ncbi:YiiD C-terminal domain-containing protein, partial [Aeromonas hydrophila]
VGGGPVSFGRIPHRQMIKSLSPLQTIQYRPEWCQDLTTRWSRGVPISEKMGMHISHYDGQTFHLKANLAANLNVHGSMFAGSVYS